MGMTPDEDYMDMARWSREAIVAIIRQQRERIAELEAAIEPFAEFGAAMLPASPGDDSVWVKSPDNTPVLNLSMFHFNFGHYRAAARALPMKDEEGEA